MASSVTNDPTYLKCWTRKKIVNLNSQSVNKVFRFDAVWYLAKIGPVALTSCAYTFRAIPKLVNEKKILRLHTYSLHVCVYVYFPRQYTHGVWVVAGGFRTPYLIKHRLMPHRAACLCFNFDFLLLLFFFYKYRKVQMANYRCISINFMIQYKGRVTLNARPTTKSVKTFRRIKITIMTLRSSIK